MRLNRQPARMHSRISAAQFNPCPMPRELNLLAAAAGAGLDAYQIIRQQDGLRMVPSPKAYMKGPAEHQHFQARERQDGPHSQKGQCSGDRKRNQADAREEKHRGARPQRAIRRDLEHQYVVHDRSKETGPRSPDHTEAIFSTAREPACRPHRAAALVARNCLRAQQRVAEATEAQPDHDDILIPCLLVSDYDPTHIDDDAHTFGTNMRRCGTLETAGTDIGRRGAVSAACCCD